MPKSLTEMQYAELLLERDRNRAILSSLNEGVISTDQNGNVAYINPSAEMLLGINNKESKGKAITAIFTLVDEDTDLPISFSQQTAVAEYQSNNSYSYGKHILKRHDGIETYISWKSTPIVDKSNAPFGDVITFQDISDTRNLTLQLKHQSTHDNLTGLVNNNEFNKRLNSLMTTSYGTDAIHGLIHLDLDQFTAINKDCGFQTGDNLLKQISAILKPIIRGRDTLARISSDKFAVLLENCPKKITLKIATDLLNVIKDFRFIWDNAAFDIHANIGVAYFSSNPLDESNDPLNTANNACLKAKEKGRDEIVEIDTSYPLNPAETPQAETHWVSRIKTALKENRLLLFQQTIAPIKPNNERLHFEILLRMQNKNGEIVLPDAFLPVAERYKMIGKIDHWVIENTFKWLAENPNVHSNTHLCSINLSALSLSDQTLSNFVNNCFSKYSIAHHKICFEITETSAIQNLNSATIFMRLMQQLGCSFSLDDFGTGMSSFSYLKNLPVNHLKIDGSFIRHIANDPIDLAMARSINDIGHVMGMKTVAEFVESPDILQLLKDIGVNYAQGYHIAKPAPLSELRKLV